MECFEPTKTFLKRLEGVEGLSGKKAFAFDTKMRSSLAGSAGVKIEGKLKSLGLTIVKRHVSAIVEGGEGPLEEGAEEMFKTIRRRVSQDDVANAMMERQHS